MLGNFSEEELRAELVRRKLERPQLLERPDMTDLAVLCEEYMETMFSGGRFKDGRQYIYEKTLECLYGTNVWVTLNKAPGSDE
jgi:hypothetical protein